jgi:hypothetical protein
MRPGAVTSIQGTACEYGVNISASFARCLGSDSAAAAKITRNILVARQAVERLVLTCE